MMCEQGPVLVIGGGVAGAAAAAHLAQAGRRVVLIERKAAAHDKVCGEFISGEAALDLRDLGLDLPALGAVPIETVRLCAGRKVIGAPLPFPALSLSRRVLDAALIDLATRRGAEVRRGRTVRALRGQGDAFLTELDDASAITAKTVFLATGKHDLKGWKRPPGTQGDLIGFKLHSRLAPDEAAALGRSVELHLFPGGYAGLEPVEGGLANLCLVVRRGHLAALGQRWDALLAALRGACPVLAQRLAGAQCMHARPLAVASIPYGLVQTRSTGPWLLGDQAAVIPSFSGDGIAIALHSARLAARLCVAGATAEAYQKRLAQDVARQVHYATLLSQLLVRPAGQTIAAAAARVVPSLMAGIARATRLPEAATRRTRSPVLGEPMLEH